MMSFTGTASAQWVQDSIERVTTTSGTLMDGDSQFARVSGNGRYVVFHTDATNVIPAGTPEDGSGDWPDYDGADEDEENNVFLYDQETGKLELISVSTGGELGNGCSTKPSVSADGRYVVFQSSSDNLTADDVNESADIFLRDRVAKTTICVSKRDGSIDPGDSDDECADWPQISADGTRITYRSAAIDIVPGAEVNCPNIFVYDVALRTTKIASVSNDGDVPDDATHWPTLSGNGRYVAFRGHDELADDSQDDGSCYPQVFVRDLKDGKTTLASVSLDGYTSEGQSRWPSLSSDGRYIAFQSSAGDLVEDDNNGDSDIFVRDLVDGVTTRVSVALDPAEEADNCSRNPAISADGRYVTFSSWASNLVDNDTNDSEDVFVYDMTTGETDLLSEDYPSQNDSDEDFGKPSISSNGYTIAFHSDAEVGGDTYSHIYVTNRELDYEPVPVAGSNRFATSVAASKEAFPDGADDVVIATGRNWPDALGGAALAGALDAPVLLVDTDSVPAVIATEIKRLGADRALILGGTDAVSSSVETALRGMKLSVKRMGGATRYETAELIAARTVDVLGPDYDGTAFVATGNNFADALSASPLACAGGWPVYLSGKNSVSASTLAAMKAAGVKKAILLGGDAAVTPQTSVTILEAGISAVRIDGDTRYETATKIATYGVNDLGLSWDGLAVTTGIDFPDALSGGVMQGRNSSVMLLTKPDALSGDTRACLVMHAHRIGEVRYLGGLNAVSQSVRDSVAGIIK